MPFVFEKCSVSSCWACATKKPTVKDDKDEEPDWIVDFFLPNEVRIAAWTPLENYSSTWSFHERLPDSLQSMMMLFEVVAAG